MSMFMPMSHSFYEEELENDKKITKTRTLTSEEIIFLIKNCNAPFVENAEKLCNNCPLVGDCLYYFTGDDSEGTVLK